MGGVSIYLIVAAALVIGPSSAHAGLPKCNADAGQAEKDCKQAADQVNAKDKSRSAATGAGAGDDINQNCDKIGKDISQQQGEAGLAKAKCEASLKKCGDSCKESDTAAPIDPAKSIEQGNISKRRSRCQNDITPKIGELSQALSQLANNANQAGACKQASDKGGGGAPPPIPPMTPAEKKGEQKKEAMKCDSSEGVRYSDCNGLYIAKCTPNMSVAGCQEFAGRYCGSATSGTQTDVTVSGGAGVQRENFAKAQALKTQSRGFNTASVVVDKGGEGLGTGFCRMVTAYKFCQATGRGECPSCKGMHDYNSPVCQNDPSKCMASLSHEGLVAAKNKCPTDPLFLDPAVQKKMTEAEAGKKETVDAGQRVKVPDRLGGGGATGGGGGSGPGGAGSAARGGGLDGATPESLPVGTAVGIDTSSGGGGGSGGSSGQSPTDEVEEDSKPRGLSTESILPAESVTGMPRDISNQFGPNVFSISSAVYKSMCGKGTLSRCQPRK